MKPTDRKSCSKTGGKVTPKRGKAIDQARERDLVDHQTDLNVRIRMNNERQSALTKSLEVYQLGKQYLAEKEAELVQLSNSINQLCLEVSESEEEVKSWRDKLTIKELEVQQMETDLKSEVLETERTQQDIEILNGKMSEILRIIEMKSRTKSQEAVELEEKERILKEKTEELEAERREFEKKRTALDGWNYDQRSGPPLKETFAKLKAELLIKDAQISSQLSAYQSQQSHLTQLEEALKREFRRISSEKGDAERHKSELDAHEEQIAAQMIQLEKMTEEVKSQIEKLGEELESAQTRKAEFQSKCGTLSQQIAGEKALKADLDHKLESARIKDEETAQTLAEAAATEEELRKKELELEQQELDLARDLKELERKEQILSHRREMEGEIELRLESLMLSEDVYNRRHHQEMNVLGDILSKLQQRERELSDE